MHISKIILASALTLSWSGAMAIDLPSLPAKEGCDVKGYVHDGTKGVAGVLVSDGYSFATTGDDGSYYLTSAPDAYCVFVVLPSGYEIATVEQGITKHFVTLDRSNSDFQADFQLNPIGDDTNFTFLAHADSQPDTYIAPNCWSSMNTAYKDMQQTGMEIAAKDGFKPFNLHMGDIVYNTNNTVADYQRYKDNLVASGYNIPIFATPGNHDRRYQTDYAAATAFYRETWGPLWYSFNRGQVHFISLDNVKVEVDGDYVRGYESAAAAWLAKDLSYVPKGSRVVFFTHQPMTRSKASVKSYGPLLELLKDYNTLILTGHLHRTFNNFPEYAPTIMERNMSAIAGYEWRGPCSEDGTPLGYWIYTVNGDDISWKFKWTGRDADRFMMRMYEPGKFGLPTYAAEDEKTILVNVWDYDAAWKVTWTLDGKEMGDLPAYEAKTDPWAVYNYNNNPERPWFEGVKETYHIFHCDVPNTGSVVSVTATDRFGRTTTNSLTLPSVQGGVETIASDGSGIARTEVYTVGGMKVFDTDGYPVAETLPLEAGCYIWRLTMTDGSVQTEKHLIR